MVASGSHSEVLHVWVIGVAVVAPYVTVQPSCSLAAWPQQQPGDCWTQRQHENGHEDGARKSELQAVQTAEGDSSL